MAANISTPHLVHGGETSTEAPVFSPSFQRVIHLLRVTETTFEPESDQVFVWLATRIDVAFWEEGRRGIR